MADFSAETVPSLEGLSPRKALATFTEWLNRQSAADKLQGDLNRLAESVRMSLNTVALNANNPDAL